MYILALPNKIHPYILLGVEGLSKNFSFWTVPLGFFAMLKIKSLMYKDLIFNSRGCRKSNQLLRHPHRFCLNQRHPCPYWRRVLVLRLKHRFTDRMSVVLSSIEFLVGKTRSSEMSTDGHFWTLPSWGDSECRVCKMQTRLLTCAHSSHQCSSFQSSHFVQLLHFKVLFVRLISRRPIRKRKFPNRSNDSAYKWLGIFIKRTVFSAFQMKERVNQYEFTVCSNTITMQDRLLKLLLQRNDIVDL